MQLIHWAFFLAFLTLVEFVFARYYDPRVSRCPDACPTVYTQLVVHATASWSYLTAVFCGAVFAALLDCTLYLWLISTGSRGESSVTLFTAISFLPSLFLLAPFSEFGPFALLEQALLVLFFCLGSDAAFQNCLDFLRPLFPAGAVRSRVLWWRRRRGSGAAPKGSAVRKPGGTGYDRGGGARGGRVGGGRASGSGPGFLYIPAPDSTRGGHAHRLGAPAPQPVSRARLEGGQSFLNPWQRPRGSPPGMRRGSERLPPGSLSSQPAAAVAAPASRGCAGSSVDRARAQECQGYQGCQRCQAFQGYQGRQSCQNCQLGRQLDTQTLRWGLQGLLAGLLLVVDRSYLPLMIFLIFKAPYRCPALQEAQEAQTTRRQAPRSSSRLQAQLSTQPGASFSSRSLARSPCSTGAPGSSGPARSTGFTGSAGSAGPTGPTAFAPRPAQRSACQPGAASTALYGTFLAVILLISLLEGPGSLLESGGYRNSGRVFYYRYLYTLRVFLQSRVSQLLDLYPFIWTGVAILVAVIGALFGRLHLPTDCFAVAVILFICRVLSPSGAPLVALALSVAGAALAGGDQYLAIFSSLAFVSEFLVAELPRTACRDILYVSAGLFLGYWGAVRFMLHKSLVKEARSFKYSIHILVLSLVLFGLAIPIVILNSFSRSSRKARVAVFVLRIVFEPFRIATYILTLIALAGARRRARPARSARSAKEARAGRARGPESVGERRVLQSAYALDRELNLELDRELERSAAVYDSLG